MAEYKDITPLKKQVADFKKAVGSPNSDYLKGYLCALSATEGIIAELPTADVVEVVRCKDCCWCMVTSQPYAGAYCIKGTRSFIVEADDFCSRGERKE